MFTHSIRWRWQLWLAFLLVCVLSGFGVTIYQLQRITQLNRLDEELGRRVAVLNLAVRGGGGAPPEMGRRFPRRNGFEGEFGPEPRGMPPLRGRPEGGPPDEAFGPHWGPRWGRREVRLPAEAAALFADEGPGAFYFATWSRESSLLRQSTNAPADVPCPERSARDTRLHFRERDVLREAYQFTEIGDCILAGRSLSADRQAQRRLRGMLFIAGGAVLALGLGGGWWLTTRAIRPLEQMSAAARRISAGNLSERLTSPHPDNEMGRLAGVLNNTFARLEDAFTQQKQFTADASHELRTPLAVLITEAQTTLARQRTGAEYKETIEANLATAQHMRRLTESLLTLARLDSGHDPLQRERFDLTRLARECVDPLRPLAAARQIQIHSDLPATACDGDPTRLGQVITNLLTNALHYNRDGGEVRVSTKSEAGAAVLTITDTGIGIAAEDLPHIFERFYRADKSRARAEGRSGLGLAITRAIVEAHGGRVEVSSVPATGTTFTVRLPLAQEPASARAGGASA